MSYFIIGDIHGCYFTLREILDEHWDYKREKLILLGDFVNKGKHTFAVLEFLIKLQKKHQKKVLILKGNNEYFFVQHFSDAIDLVTKQKFENYNMNYNKTLNWIDSLHHFYENSLFFASHAGIAEDVKLPIEKENTSVLFNRKPLKNIGKKQFIGHIVVDEPQYDMEANAIYLDTGAGFGMNLSGVKFDENENNYKFITLKINEKDKSN